MEQQSASNTDPIKVLCPHCGSHECLEDTLVMETKEIVNSYMCMDCGYTTSTLNVEGSQVIKHYEDTTAELIKELRWVDDKNLVWYPTVLNFPSSGIIFPDGTNEHNWVWNAAPAVDIALEEQSKYPIPGQKDQYYTRRIDMEAGRKFLKTDFYGACLFLGFVQPKA